MDRVLNSLAWLLRPAQSGFQALSEWWNDLSGNERAVASLVVLGVILTLLYIEYWREIKNIENKKD